MSALTILRLAERSRMSFRVRAARGEDFDAIYEMAKLTGGGFTNLPADRGTLVAKLARSGQFVRKDKATSRPATSTCSCSKTRRPGVIRGTCQIFGKVGVVQPFYSYHLSTLTQSSPELGKTFRNQMLSLTTDLEGSFRGRRPVPPSRRPARAAGARSSPAAAICSSSSIAPRFGDRILAELRGVMDEAGNSPFWDGLAGRFFDMSFPEADRVQRDARHAVHRRFDAPHADLRGPARRRGPGGHRPAASDRAGRRCGCSRRKVSSSTATSTFSTAARPSLAPDRRHPNRPRIRGRNGARESATAGKQRMILATGKLHDFVACGAIAKRVPGKGLMHRCRGGRSCSA